MELRAAVLESKIKEIIKRDGRTVPYSSEKIYTAVMKAAQHIGENPQAAAGVTNLVEKYLDQKFKDMKPHVENIQDLVVSSNGRAWLCRTKRSLCKIPSSTK